MMVIVVAKGYISCLMGNDATFIYLKGQYKYLSEEWHQLWKKL